MKKYIIGSFIAGFMLLCVLSYLGIFSCAGCGGELTWDGNCSSPLAVQIKDKCCMDVDMCAGYTTQSPSECYHRYCPAADKFCQPGEYDIATQTYTCECGSIYT